MSELRVDAALIALRRIFRATELASRSLAKQYGLTPSQLLLLQVVDGIGRATPSDVARMTSLGQATVTSLLDKLEARGMLVRKRSSLDKRRVEIELLEEGRHALSAVPGSLQQRFQDDFNAMEPWEQAFLVAALERTAAMLGAANVDAAPILDSGTIPPL